MLLFMLLTALAVITLAPFRVKANLAIYESIRLDIAFSCLGLKKLIHLSSGDSGWVITVSNRHSNRMSAIHPTLNAEHMISAIKMSSKARRFLFRNLCIEQINASIRFHAEHAARTAVFTGLLRILTANLPRQFRDRCFLYIQPEFGTIPTSIWVQGIISCRLGILLLSAAIIAAEWLWKQIICNKEAISWNTRSAN